jgi:hypothetical protein
VLSGLRASNRFDVQILDAVAGYHPTHAEYEVRKLPLKEIQAGMALEKDVLSKDGNLLILKEGTVLTDTWIERLENFARTRGLEELVEVRIPLLTAAAEEGLPWLKTTS